eukprot:gene5037-6268_t
MYNNNNNGGYGGGGYGGGRNNNNNGGYGGGGYGGGFNNNQQQNNYNNNNYNNNNNNYNNNYNNNNNNNYNQQNNYNDNQYGGGSNNDNNYDDVSMNPDYQSTAKTIAQIQSAVINLNRLVQQLGTSRDSMDVREKIRSNVESTTGLISQESSKVKSLTALASRTKDSRNKQLYHKLVNDYNNSLKQFKEIAQDATRRERSTPLPPQQQQQQQSALSNQHQNNRNNYNNNYSQQQQQYYEDDKEDENQSLMESSRRQQLAQIESEREYHNSIIQEREEGIKQIEQSIVEINEIFLDLSNLVAEDGVRLNNIEANIESSHLNVKEGVQELHQASKYQRSSRTKMCWLALILIVVAGVLAVILYFTLRKK